MVTKGLTKRQKAGFILPRLKKFSIARIKFLEIQHANIVSQQIARHSSERLDKFETYYLSEYNPFSKPFRLTRRIERRKDPRTGRIISTGFFYQIVYKDPKTGRNLSSPLRDYINMVNRKVDEASKFTVVGEEAQHLKEHLQHKLQEKHITSLRNYIKVKTGQVIEVKEK